MLQRSATKARRQILLIGTLTLLFVSLIVVTHHGLSGNDAPGMMAPWQDFTHITTTSSQSDFTPAPKIAVAPDKTMIIAFNYVNNGVQQPYYSRSEDGGLTWSPDAPIHTSASDRRYVSVAFDRNSVAHAVWRSSDAVFHAAEGQWSSNGFTALPSPADGQRILDPPSLATGNDGSLHVVWAQGDTQPNIFHAFSTNGGTDWNLSPALATNTRRSSVPVVGIDGSGNAHVVWEERVFDSSVPGLFRSEIHYMMGERSGSSYNWDATPTIVSGDLITSKRPSLLTHDGAIHIAFTDQVSNQEQYAYYTTATNQTDWSEPVDVSQGISVRVNTSNPYYLITVLSACDGHVHVYYHGAAESNTREQIWGATSADGWSTLQEVTDPDERYIYPSLACLNGNLQLAVELVQQAETNHQVYYGSTKHTTYLPVTLNP